MSQTSPTPAGALAPGKLADFFRYYDGGNAHHRLAVAILEKALPAPLFTQASQWVVEYRKGRSAPTGEVKLPVEYLRQGDSAVPGQGPRMCFSSSNAMLVNWLKPNALGASGQKDDQYLQRVFVYGDTTDAAAQLRALRHFGLDATFKSNMDWDDVDAQLARRVPVPIGILHHGTADHPTGGGHWILVIGRSADGKSYLVHDPAGELDLVHGGHGLGKSGKSVWYSRANLGRRWMVDGPATGWGIWVSAS